MDSKDFHSTPNKPNILERESPEIAQQQRMMKNNNFLTVIEDTPDQVREETHNTLNDREEPI
jgi:hypothetical protein